MAVTAIALGILYAGLFGNDLSVQLPYILVGFIIWGFISGCIAEGAEVFIANVGLITHLPAPLSVHVYRLIWRRCSSSCTTSSSTWSCWWSSRSRCTGPLAGRVPGLRAAGPQRRLGRAAARHRHDPVPRPHPDHPVGSSSWPFFLTPIVWIYEDLLNSPNPAIAERARIAELNPFLHFVEIMRRPMLGQSLDPPTGWSCSSSRCWAGRSRCGLCGATARDAYWV